VRIERDQATINRADIDHAFPDRDAAVDHVAAGRNAARLVDLGIELPEPLARLGVVGVNHRPGGGEIHHAIDHDGRRFHAAIGVERRRPGDADILVTVSAVICFSGE
jgi:hypothetical protein